MFSWELFIASQKELLLWYTEWYDSHFLVHQMAWGTFNHLCKKVQKSTKKYEKVGKEILHEQSMHHWCSANLQQFYPLCTSIISLETEVEILGLGCKRKHDLIYQYKVNKAYKFVLYMSKQSINFKNAETSWFRGLFLHLHTKKMISVHQHMPFVTVNRFCLL